ncbi:MAG: cupin domain-containing protein [Polyangiaceae bacterium]
MSETKDLQLFEALCGARGPRAQRRAEDELAKSGLSDAEKRKMRDLAHALALGIRPDGSDGLDDVAPRSLRERILASTSRPGPFGRYADRVGRLFGLDTTRAEAILADLARPDAFVDSGIPGIEIYTVMDVPSSMDGIATITRFAPGSRFPEHAHNGDETTLVLAGGFTDASGLEIERGDELWKERDSAHHFDVFDDEPCVAAVFARGGITFR